MKQLRYIGILPTCKRSLIFVIPTTTELFRQHCPRQVSWPPDPVFFDGKATQRTTSYVWVTDWSPCEQRRIRDILLYYSFISHFTQLSFISLSPRLFPSLLLFSVVLCTFTFSHFSTHFYSQGSRARKKITCMPTSFVKKRMFLIKLDKF